MRQNTFHCRSKTSPGRFMPYLQADESHFPVSQIKVPETRENGTRIGHTRRRLALSLLIIPSSFAVKHLRHLPRYPRRARMLGFDDERGSEMGVLKAVLVFLRAFILGRAAAAENLALRQQLAALNQSVKRPRLRPRDRIFWVLLSRLWPNWRSALAIVQPETVVHWYRQGFKLFWRWKLRTRKPGHPRIEREIRDLIRPFGKIMPHSRQYESRLGVMPRDRECPERLEAIVVSRQFNAAIAARFAKTANYFAMFEGAADRCWVCQKSESKRKRLSVSKGTREARLSRVVLVSGAISRIYLARHKALSRARAKPAVIAASVAAVIAAIVAMFGFMS